MVANLTKKDMSLISAESPIESCELPVDLQYLQKVLNDSCGAAGMIASTRSTVVGKGKGFGSVITKVVIDWTGDEQALSTLPKSVVLKQPTLEKMKEMIPEGNDEGRFNANVLRTIHNNEVRAYQFLTKYQPCPIPMARLYHCELMEGPGSGIIVMEDLTETTISLSFTEEATKEQALAVIQCFASVQAYGFRHPDWQDYIKIMESHVFEKPLSDKDKLVTAVYDQFPQLALSKDRLLEMLDKAMEEYKWFQDPTSCGFTPVCCLGDCQPNNILWYKTKDGKPSNQIAAFIDFQVAHVGYCCTDWMSFSGLCLNPPIRRVCEDEMIKQYFNKLSQESEGLSLKIDEPEFRRGYRKLMLIYSIMTFPMFAGALGYVGIEDSFKETLFQRLHSYIEDSQIIDY